MDDTIEPALQTAPPAASPVPSGATPPAVAVSTARSVTALAIAVYGVVVVLAWVALELWGLGAEPFHTKGEPREGLVVWEMTHGGGWILPKRNGVELPSKPPLFHWLAAVTSLTRGAADEWSIRFPSAALSLLGVLGVFAAGCRLWSPRAGLLSALTLMTTFEWARAATGARVDMTLTFGLQLAFLSLLFFLRDRRTAWLVPLYAGIAWAVLGKGPVGVALPGLVALTMGALTRDVGPLRQLRLLWGAVAVAVVAGSWYVMALIVGGTAFFRKQVLAENVFTFLDNASFGGGHRHSVLYLFGTLLLGVLPWTLYLPGVAARLWRQRRDIPPYDPRVFLLVWTFVVFAFYAVAASKRSVYLLGCYPAIGLLCGWWWDAQSRAPSDDDRWLTHVVRGAGWILLGILLPVGAVIALESFGAPIAGAVGRSLSATAQPLVPAISAGLRANRWLVLGLLALMLGGAYGLARTARAAHWLGMFAATLLVIGAGLTLVRQVVMPAVATQLTLRTFMARVRDVLGPDEDLYFYKVFDYGAVFYWNGHIQQYRPGTGRFVLIRQSQWEHLDAAEQRQFALVTLPGDPGHGGRDRLVLIRRVDAP